MYAGGSARDKAASLRVEAAALREQAELRAQEAQQWDAGADGEVRVAHELAQVEARGWLVLHDRLIRPESSQANLDHLAFGPAGLVLIDSRNWSAGAWVHDGTLFRRGASGPTPCHDVLAHIARDAAEVHRRLGVPVTPVLCLSGARSGSITDAVEVAGVRVVPVARLARLLLSLPSLPPAADAPPLVARLEAEFPTACAEPPVAAPPVAAPPFRARGRAPRAVPAGRRRSAPRATAPPRSGRKIRTGSSPRARSSRSGVNAVLAVLGVLCLVTFGPRMLTSAISHALGHTPAPSPAAVRFPAPCAGVTAAQVEAAVHHAVHRLAPTTTDVCRWSYTATGSGYTADVQITTGWAAQAEAVLANGVAQPSHRSGSEGLVVPQFVAVPGSTLPASATTQPLALYVTIRAGVPRADAAAAVTTLAQLTETHMPSGAGATVVSANR